MFSGQAFHVARPKGGDSTMMEDRTRITKVIREHGGAIVNGNDTAECCASAAGPLGAPLVVVYVDPNQQPLDATALKGSIFVDARYVEDCERAGRPLSPTGYRVRAIGAAQAAPAAKAFGPRAANPAARESARRESPEKEPRGGGGGGRGTKRTRTEYTEHEDDLIIKHLVANYPPSDWEKRSTCKAMGAAVPALSHRGTESLRTHVKNLRARDPGTRGTRKTAEPGN